MPPFTLDALFVCPMHYAILIQPARGDVLCHMRCDAVQAPLVCLIPFDTHPTLLLNIHHFLCCHMVLPGGTADVDTPPDIGGV